MINDQEKEIEAQNAPKEEPAGAAVGDAKGGAGGADKNKNKGGGGGKRRPT